MTPAADKRCVVPDCKFVWYKGHLCRKHWDMVPIDARIVCSVAASQAAVKTADQHHRKMERELVARLGSSRSES